MKSGLCHVAIVALVAVSCVGAQFFGVHQPTLGVVPRTQQQSLCPSVGFFRDPEDCTRFHRCVDLFGLGFYSIYFFACPQGTVFDEAVSVCNWPWAAKPCNGGSGPAPAPPTAPIAPSPPSVPAPPPPPSNGDNTVVAPAFDYVCTAPGFFADEGNCQRFWLCNPETFKLTAELFRCPEGFNYHDDIRRCLEKEKVDCAGRPEDTSDSDGDEDDDGRIGHPKRKVTQLRKHELDAFFRRFRFF